MGKDGGDGGSPGYYHDYSQWTEAERAYVSQEGMEGLQTAYDQGYIQLSPSQLASWVAPQKYAHQRYNTTEQAMMDVLEQTGLNPKTWSEWEYQFSEEKAAEEAATEAAHQQLLASRDELIASGIPAYTLDPTPWDEVTAADEAEMAQLQVEYIAEQKRIEEEEAAAAALAEQQAAIEADLGTMEELASLRNESEALAEADVNEYILEKTQAMKLRGVTPPFTDEMKEELVNTRFAEYWSTANESQLQALISQYGEEYGYPDISERILGASTTSLLTTSTSTAASTSAEAQAIAAAVGTSTEQTLLTKGLLEEDLEVLGAGTLLGG